MGGSDRGDLRWRDLRRDLRRGPERGPERWDLRWGTREGEYGLGRGTLTALSLVFNISPFFTDSGGRSLTNAAVGGWGCPATSEVTCHNLTGG